MVPQVHNHLELRERVELLNNRYACILELLNVVRRERSHCKTLLDPVYFYEGHVMSVMRITGVSLPARYITFRSEIASCAGLPCSCAGQ